MEYRTVSVDDHATEGPTTFTDRVPSHLKDRVPAIRPDEDGISHWWVGDRKLSMAGHYLSGEEERQIRSQKLKGYASLSARTPLGDWDPNARLKDYDLDGVDAGIMFSNFGGFAALLQDDPEARFAAVQAFNDWMIDEWCATDPKRLFGLAQLPLWDPEASVKEAVRAVEKGHRGVIFPQLPDMQGYAPMWDPEWNGLFATMEELDLPIAIHVSNTPYATLGVRSERNPNGESPLPEFLNTVANTSGAFSNMYPLLEWVYSGHLERFPRLKLFLGESGASWVPFAMYQVDHYFPVFSRFFSMDLRMKPSEYIRRNMYHGFYYDWITPALLEVVGEDKLMWEGDYVHAVSTFPNSRGAQRDSMKDITDETQRHKLLAGNAVKLFKLDQ